MTYAETLEFLYAQLPMYQRQGAPAMKKDLTNTIRLLDGLDNPHRKFRSIHIGGTNGKGSTAHLIAGVLQSHGYRTGLYTSPHYRDFRERIKIDGSFVSKQFVRGFVERVRPLIEAIQPSFFELTVAMAFDYFARKHVDVAVVEVGLGGRLDSTNVLQPELAIITNISFDHQQFLGNTLPLIAGEKAGIIKAETPVVIGEYQEAVREVFLEKARSVRAPLFFADRNWTMERNKFGTWDFASRDRLLVQDVAFELLGSFQRKNLLTAVAALDTLGYYTDWFDLNRTTLREGLSNFQERTNYIERVKQLGQHPTVLAGSAHNEAGFAYLSEIFDRERYPHFHIVLGVVNDKDLSKMLPHFPQEATYYFAKADIPRGLPAARLRDAAQEFGLMGNAYASVPNALAAARDAASARDLIYVGGSIFTVAEVL